MFAHRLLCLTLAASFASILALAGCASGGSSAGTQQPPPAKDNPAPIITSVAPATVVAASASQTLTVTGTGFISSSVVNFNNIALTTTYVSSTSVTAALPASAIVADGSAKVTVTNPSPGGGTSAAIGFVIAVPTPALASLLPQNVPQGAAATITIAGSGFEANSVAQWNGSPRPTAFVNSTTLQITLTAADAASFGSGQISVVNPNVAPSTPLDLYIYANTPTITYISPNAIQPYTGTLPLQIILGGSGFAAAAIVQANGALIPVISQTSTVITVALPASSVATPGTVNFVVSNPGSPVVSSNAVSLAVVSPAAPSFTVTPNAVAAGSPDTTVTLNGTGFYKDSIVQWNGTPLTTNYVSATQVTAVIPSADLTGFVQATITVNTPENTSQAPPQPFSTYLELPVNDIVYNPVDGLIYASIPGSAGEGLGNTVAAIDPTTGVIQKTIFVGSEPNRLALSTDGTQLFVGLNGAGAVRQVNLTTGTASTQFSLGGGNGIYVPPYTAVGLAAVPGQPNSVAVYSSNGVVTIYDSGVARVNSSSGLSTYFTQNVGALTFGSSAGTLYVMSNAIGGYLYQLTVDSTGITAASQIANGTGGSTLQYDSGYLYVPVGVAYNASTGAVAGQFSVPDGSSTPTAAVGPIFSDSSLQRVWVVPTNFNSTALIVAYNANTYDPVGSIPITGINSSYPSYSTPADLVRWGQDGLAFHTANQLYVLQSPIVKDNTSSPADVSVTVAAPASATTGTPANWTIKVANLGPNAAQGVTVNGMLPAGVIFGSIQVSQGSCSAPANSTVTLATSPAAAAPPSPSLSHRRTLTRCNSPPALPRSATIRSPPITSPPQTLWLRAQLTMHRRW